MHLSASFECEQLFSIERPCVSIEVQLRKIIAMWQVEIDRGDSLAAAKSHSALSSIALFGAEDPMRHLQRNALLLNPGAFFTQKSPEQQFR